MWDNRSQGVPAFDNAVVAIFRVVVLDDFRYARRQAIDLRSKIRFFSGLASAVRPGASIFAGSAVSSGDNGACGRLTFITGAWMTESVFACWTGVFGVATRGDGAKRPNFLRSNPPTARIEIPAPENSHSLIYSYPMSHLDTFYGRAPTVNL